MDLGLAGKIAVVTGASQGIGRAIAAVLAREGAHLTIAARREPQLRDLAEELQATYGTKVLVVPADLRTEPAIQDLVRRTLDAYGQIDILINNAGANQRGGPLELDDEAWLADQQLRPLGYVRACRAVLPHMIERGSGVIVNMASQLGQVGGVEMVHYSASKAGVIGFTKALAREVSARGVRVNAIAPGPILTAMMADETEEWRAAKLAELPIGRFGEVDEVAPTAVFLASDDARYYVGQTLGPNGGDVML